ncbi:uncharacterized protein E5676_scaffold1428G00120 [Cucumis melo var. makuwa]|uniref:Uncharacterized protein n=1 Tax=Cucumis melo var. makuwa TaxID=1194695 RepID=A0A5D3DGD2_CUCMM|nr:uncharacterized protein E6C27_scaffold80G002740 [Cucumis melo var. makuwa]TYK22309.1 uncharacterized protein E5676_scaffold1428G00120 [Cucumis melo var. makuwa]
MAKADYDFTAHTKSLKIDEQPELSSTQKKLLHKGHVIPVSRKELEYKLPEPIHIPRKGKEKVVDSNHITIEDIDSMEEKRRDGSPHVKTGSSIDTKKKESTSHALVWSKIKNIDVEKYHDKEFPCQGSLKVKKHDVILTNPKKEVLEQGEGEPSCHHITVIEKSEIITPKEDAKDDP